MKDISHYGGLSNTMKDNSSTINNNDIEIVTPLHFPFTTAEDFKLRKVD
jgi:hypothetical protein